MIAERFRAADTIILIDFPPWRHFWWAAKRRVKSIMRERDDLPENCPMLPRTRELFRLMRLVHREFIPEVKKLVQTFSDDRSVLVFNSPRDLRRFMAQYC